MLERLVQLGARRPRRVLFIVALLALAGAVSALRLVPDGGTDTLVSKGTDTYAATEVYRDRFGDHAVLVHVRGPLESLVLTADLTRLIALEGCLSGNAPDPRGGAGSPCGRLRSSRVVKVVYGPGTFINAAVGEVQNELARTQAATAAASQAAARAARKQARESGASAADARAAADAAAQQVEQEALRGLAGVALRYGLQARIPTIQDTAFVQRIVFDPRRGSAYQPKARFAYLFPSANAALIQVRLRPDLTPAERTQAIADIRAAVAMPDFALPSGSTYAVTGAPILVEGLSRSLAGSLVLLLLAALVVMGAMLLVLLRGRPRPLLPLGVAVAAGGLTFGAMSLAGIRLTMASIAVLPVLLGLAVDYAIQYQARVAETGSPQAAARRGVPTIATAALATVAGFSVLLLSPVPMVRDFGLLLILGVVLGLACALTAGTAVLVRSRRAPATHLVARSGRGALALAAPAGRGAARLLAPVARPLSRRGRRLGTASLGLALRRPGRVLAVGAVVAAFGWVADTQVEVVSNVDELVPASLTELRDLRALQADSSVAGEVDVVVEGDDLARPEVVTWMRRYSERMLDRFGYTAEGGCQRARLCPGPSLADLFRSGAAPEDPAQIRALLDSVPEYFSRAVVTADRKTAVLGFGVRIGPLDRQQEVLEEMRAELDPPAGVTARLAGLPVLAAEANEALSSPARRLGTLAASLLAVALALLLVTRSWRRALVPLVPIVLATGWSAALLWLLQIPLNPLSAVLGALVVAISTEFSVLLAARYREERAAGFGVEEAVRRTYASTGAAVTASGLTALAGFAVLVLSDVRMVRDFGFVTVVDLGVSLLGVLVVLPAVLVLAERRLPAHAGAARTTAVAAGAGR